MVISSSVGKTTMSKNGRMLGGRTDKGKARGCIDRYINDINVVDGGDDGGG